MVAYCNNCKRYVNQYCDKCGDNFGIAMCEKYACGGTMRCPFCGGNDLTAKKEFGPDPYDYRGKSKEERSMASPPEERRQAPAPKASQCPMCGFKIDTNWKYCPMCGVAFQMKK